MLTLGWAGTKRGKLRLRRAACRLAELALVVRSRRLDCTGLRTVLIVAPHPDDEAFGCGGTLALLAGGAPLVRILFVTDGRASHPGHPSVAPEALADMRRGEALLSAQKLGIDLNRVGFINMPDGSLCHLAEDRRREVAREIAGRLASECPDAIFLPGRSDGSSEHEAAFALVQKAAELAGVSPRMLEFPVWSWWNPLRLAPLLLGPQRIWRVDVRPALRAKADAVACYASQTRPLPPDTDPALPEGFALMFLRRYEFFFEH